MDATYDALLKSTTMKSNDLVAFGNFHFTCTPAVKKGKTYDINDITCTLAGLDMFKAMKSAVGKTSDMSAKFNDKELTMISGAYTGTLTKSSGFWGCFQLWSLILLIVVIIVIILLIVLLIVKCTSKKTIKKSSK